MTPLIGHLPEYYQNSAEMTAIQNALSALMAELWANRDAFAAQLCPATATWGLAAWEKALGLATDETAPPETRRASIEMQLRSTSTVTVEILERVAAAAFGGDVEVVEHPEESRLELRSLVIYGPPANLSALTVQLKNLIPAHLAWSYIIRHYNWAQMEAMFPAWSGIDGKTWAELKANDE